MPNSYSIPRNPDIRNRNGEDRNRNEAIVLSHGSTNGSGECYACTQIGVPAFHSTSCDSYQQPNWEASAGSSLVPIQNKSKGSSVRVEPRFKSGSFIKILDPKSKSVKIWNRMLLLARVIALAIDPLFFYVFSIGRDGKPCLYMDEKLAQGVMLARSGVDAFHLCHMWMQFTSAYVSRESLVIGSGKLVWNARSIAAHYVRAFKGFWFDLFVILPIPQVVIWFIVPILMKHEQTNIIMAIMLSMFLFQIIPKLYHCIYLIKKMQKVTGYVFGTVWWGFGLNFIVYFLGSHMFGGVWYMLAIQRVGTCIKQQCQRTPGCNLSVGSIGNPCTGNIKLAGKEPVCLSAEGAFKFGIYEWALPIISAESLAIKFLYPIYWGMINLSTVGNVLEPSRNWLEVIFSIYVVVTGLLIFTFLVGNIQVFLHTVMEKKRKMQLRSNDMEWWMSRRQMPSELKQRVRHFERHRWAAMGGEDEIDLIKDLPEGLRRDIKRYLCLDLIKKVPLFHNLGDLALDNICDRVKPIVFTKNEKIIREGDPVPRMVFIVRGRIKRSQSLSKGAIASSVLQPGGFFGDELLSSCLRRPFIDRLPASSATFKCIESAEAFGLDAADLKYITDHFRYEFSNERAKTAARYYSSNWRTWAAINIQIAWNRHRQRTRPIFLRNNDEQRLMQYAAMFMSIRPHDHLE
ncbi:unnamed protein product [Lupinus luteus]|uniref:Cyclic nucleotide-binding domain-containing protein n=1 Tax=Lupinus luteus TaxID=3873 RepID=A0AAV1WH07_LUPLU